MAIVPKIYNWFPGGSACETRDGETDFILRLKGWDADFFLDGDVAPSHHPSPLYLKVCDQPWVGISQFHIWGRFRVSVQNCNPVVKDLALYNHDLMWLIVCFLFMIRVGH